MVDVQRGLPGRRLEVKQAERAAGLVATRLDRHQNLQVPEGFATLRIQGEELVRHLAHLVLTYAWAGTGDPPKAGAKSVANCLNERASCSVTSLKSLVVKSPQPSAYTRP